MQTQREIAHKMISALLSVNKPRQVDRPSLQEQRAFILRYSSSLSKTHSDQLVDVLKLQGRLDDLNDVNEGLIIDLNALSEDDIHKLYDFVKSKSS